MVGGGVEKWAFCRSSLLSQKMVGVSDWTLVGLSYHAFAISGLLYMAIPPTLCKGWYGTLHWSPKGEIFCCRLLQSRETLPITTIESLKCPWEDHFLEKVPNIAIIRFPLDFMEMTAPLPWWRKNISCKRGSTLAKYLQFHNSTNQKNNSWLRNE